MKKLIWWSLQPLLPLQKEEGAGEAATDWLQQSQHVLPSAGCLLHSGSKKNIQTMDVVLKNGLVAL